MPNFKTAYYDSPRFQLIIICHAKSPNGQALTFGATVGSKAQAIELALLLFGLELSNA